MLSIRCPCSFRSYVDQKSAPEDKECTKRLPAKPLLGRVYLMLVVYAAERELGAE
jgi:hypothetical protein